MVDSVASVNIWRVVVWEFYPFPQARQGIVAAELILSGYGPLFPRQTTCGILVLIPALGETLPSVRPSALTHAASPILLCQSAQRRAV